MRVVEPGLVDGTERRPQTPCRRLADTPGRRAVPVARCIGRAGYMYHNLNTWRTMRAHHSGFFLLLGLFAAHACWGQQQDAHVSQWVRPVAEVFDLEFLEQFLEDQLIVPEHGDYESAVFVDVTNDGFGTNDLLVLQPSREQFLLSQYLQENMLNTLLALNLEEDYRLTTVRAQSAVVTDEAEAEENPRKALAGAILRSILPYYPEGPFELYVRQRTDDVSISLWGYELDLFEFAPEATLCTVPPSEPMMVKVYGEPQIRSHLDSDGCVVVERWTADGKVVSRSCE